MQIQDMMNKPVCVAPGDMLKSAVAALKTHEVGCLVVCKGKRVVGIVTDRDILMRSSEMSHSADKLTVRHVMSTHVHCCHESDDSAEVTERMERLSLRRMPVLNEKEELVGLISLTDLRGGGSRTVCVEVVFYKEVHDSSGHAHRSEQARVFVRGELGEEESVAAAIAQIESDRQRAWKDFADGYEVLRPESREDSSEKPAHA